MNPGRYIHTATWSRAVIGTSSGKRTRTWSVPASFSCLVEGLPGRVRQALIGYIPQARYRLTTSTEVRENDRIVWNSKDFILRDVTDDTTRPTGPYYTGILTEAPADGSGS